MTTGSKSVMIVDDDVDIRETLKELFEYEGYRVTTAANGCDALLLLHEMITKPCLVILDLIMPVLDGIATYHGMQADPILRAIPVVVSTSDPARAPAGVPVLRKPVPLDVLLATVKRSC